MDLRQAFFTAMTMAASSPTGSVNVDARTKKYESVFEFTIQWRAIRRGGTTFLLSSGGQWRELAPMIAEAYGVKPRCFERMHVRWSIYPEVKK